jgi:hypothetical protein
MTKMRTYSTDIHTNSSKHRERDKDQSNNNLTLAHPFARSVRDIKGQ